MGSLETLENIVVNWRKKKHLDFSPAENSGTLFDRLEKLAAHHREKEELSTANLTENWKKKVESAPSKMFSPDGKVIPSSFSNFRRIEILLGDSGPLTDYSNWNPRYWLKIFLSNPVIGAMDVARQLINGYTRSSRRHLFEYYEILEKEGALDLLKKYDVSQSPGHPYVFRYKGCAYNVRWARHVYFLNLLRKSLGAELNRREKFVSLDLGSAYGVFSHLFKAEYPKTTQILVDFPAQLILAAYYLQQAFPKARIATMLEMEEMPVISRDFIEKYDFVLIPVDSFKRLPAGSYDMMTNFVSLGEMQRQWFLHYLESPSFKTAEFFFTSNRIISGPRIEPTHNTDITIRDYPLDDFQTLLFDVNPLFTHYYKRHGFIFADRKPISSYLFDFIGHRSAHSN